MAFLSTIIGGTLNPDGGSGGSSCVVRDDGNGDIGVLRIICDTGRSFPSTNIGDV